MGPKIHIRAVITAINAMLRISKYFIFFSSLLFSVPFALSPSIRACGSIVNLSQYFG